MGGAGGEQATGIGGRAARPLPLEARRALWRRVWDRLLLPEDLRDPEEVPAHVRTDVLAKPDGPLREGR